MNKELEKIKLLNYKPKLFLHACCAPCSSYVLEYLSDYFDITLFYYNPNISPVSEFNKRVDELNKLIPQMHLNSNIKVIVGKYDNDEYNKLIKGYEDEPEGGNRCFICYRKRLLETVKYAKENGFDYWTTTLSISPYKNANKLNEIGKELEKEYNVKYLYSDFKKKNGYKRSIELSKKYNLYRQDYCGCVFSKRLKVYE